MKYFVDFQHMPKDAARPRDDGEVVPIDVSDEGGFASIPNVGDYVLIDNSTTERASFSGKVRSRLFQYICTPQADSCAVNIVLEETDDDWGELVKE